MKFHFFDTGFSIGPNDPTGFVIDLNKIIKKTTRKNQPTYLTVLTPNVPILCTRKKIFHTNHLDLPVTRKIPKNIPRGICSVALHIIRPKSQKDCANHPLLISSCSYSHWSFVQLQLASMVLNGFRGLSRQSGFVS